MAVRLGRILFAFFLLNILMVSLPANTSLAADLFAAVIRIVVAGVLAGMIGQRCRERVWW